MIKIDVKDRRLQYELDTNSRQSIPQISKKVNLHKNAVSYRIKRLKKHGIIINYYAAIDSHKLGYMVLNSILKHQKCLMQDHRTYQKDKKLINVKKQPSSIRINPVGKQCSRRDLALTSMNLQI